MKQMTVVKVGFLRRWLGMKQMSDGRCWLKVSFLRLVLFVLWVGGIHVVSIFHQVHLRVAAMKTLMRNEVRLGSLCRDLDLEI